MMMGLRSRDVNFEFCSSLMDLHLFLNVLHQCFALTTVIYHKKFVENVNRTGNAQRPMWKGTNVPLITFDQHHALDNVRPTLLF